MLPPLEVAEHALREHIARTGVDLAPYSVILSRGSLPSRDNEFIDMGLVRDEMRMRSGRMISINRIFRVQQWLAAEAFIAARWPQHQTCAVSTRCCRAWTSRPSAPTCPVVAGGGDRHRSPPRTPSSSFQRCRLTPPRRGSPSDRSEFRRRRAEFRRARADFCPCRHHFPSIRRT